MKRAGIAVIMAALAACATAQDIAVLGGANNLFTDGQGAISPYIGTDFMFVEVAEGSLVRVFQIRNRDTTSNLSIGTVTVNDPNFSVANQPLSTVAPGEADTLSIKFDPVSLGNKTCRIDIPNNDPDETPGIFTFYVQGEGVVAGPVTTTDVVVEPFPRARENRSGVVRGKARVINVGDSPSPIGTMSIYSSVDNTLSAAPPSTALSESPLPIIEPGKLKKVKVRVRPPGGHHYLFFRAGLEPSQTIDVDFTNNQNSGRY